MVMYTVSRVGNTIDGTIDTIDRITILKTSMDFTQNRQYQLSKYRM